MKESKSTPLKQAFKFTSKEYPNCFHLWEHAPYGSNIYKYMDMETALKCLESNTLRFAQPNTWKDPFERMFYTADYSDIDKNYPKTLYACCFTLNPVSEAAWKTYLYDKNEPKNEADEQKEYKKTYCVQFVISVKNLRLSIREYLERLGQMYEGSMYYSLSDFDILYLHKSSIINKNGEPNENANHKLLFGGDFNLQNYLSLLLIKRRAFKYENEYRFFIIPKTQSDDNEKQFHFEDERQHLYIGIPWKKVLKQIIVDDKCSKKDICSFMKNCKKYGITPKIIRKSNLYNYPLSNIKIQPVEKD